MLPSRWEFWTGSKEKEENEEVKMKDQTLMVVRAISAKDSTSQAIIF